jgi:hypothetical protein
MWWHYFFKNIFSGLATLLSVAAILLVYWFKKRNEKIDGARVLLMEIRNAEKTISEIKNTQAVSEASFVLPVASWQKLQHFFIKDLDNDELTLLNDFYNLCSLAQKEIDRMKGFLPTSNEEKTRLTQRKLMELAEKYKASENNFEKGSDYMKERTAILDNLFYQENSLFQPNISSLRVMTYLQNIRYVSTSSCGQKLKNIARIS